MTFKNFSDESEAQRGQPVPVDGDTSRHPEVPPDNPASKSDHEASSVAFDALSLCFSKDAADASRVAAIDSESQQTSRHVAAPGSDRPSPSHMDSTAVDDLRAQLRQTEMDIAQLKNEAAACSSRLGHLRDLAAQLAQNYTRLGESERQSKTRGEPAAALGDASDYGRVRLRRMTRDVLAGACQARSSMVHTFVLTSDKAKPGTPAVLPDLGPMAERAPQQLTTTQSSVSILTHAEKNKPPAGLWVAVMGVLITVLGIGVMRVRHHTNPIPSPGRMTQQDKAVHAPVSALPSRTRSGSSVFMSNKGPAAMMSGRPNNGASADARSTEGVVQPPAALAVGTTGSGWVSSTGRSPAIETLRESRPPQRFIGDLRVESLPSGAAVFIDQRRAGRTPLHVRRLRAGSHDIRIEHEGYERWTTAALVPTDQQTRVRARLSLTAAPTYGQ